VTADDSVSFNVIRIDVQGNRESIDLPLSGWTMYSGAINTGSPITWDAAAQGTSWVKATLEGYEVTIPMLVTHGTADTLEVLSSTFTLVSGETGTLNCRASDSDGNSWPVVGEWPALDSLTPGGTSADFLATTVGITEFYVYYTDGEIASIGTTVTITVLPGSLDSITLADDVLEGYTADDTYDLSPIAIDLYSNDLPVDSLQWLQFYRMNADSTPAPSVCSTSNSAWEDITLSMRNSGYVWGDNDDTMVGEYTICAFGPNNVQAMTIINVTWGQVANIWHKAFTSFDDEISDTNLDNHKDTRITAGDYPLVEIWVKDADGNEYQTNDVVWTSSSLGFVDLDVRLAGVNELVDIGNFRFYGAINQVYELSYSADSCSCSGTWNVTVDYGTLFLLNANASSPGTVTGTTLTVQQQAVVTLSIEGFDRYGNQIPVIITLVEDDVSDSLNVYTEGTDTSSEVYMLNPGMNTITVCADGVGTGINSCDEVEISVDGTVAGWFEATAPVSWIVLSAAVVLLLGVVVVVAILIRRGESDDEYDDDLYEDDDDYAASTPPSTPIPTTESYSEPEPQEEYTSEEDPNYRVDEDGTEWWQDDEGAWWYRDPDMDDWTEWTE